LLAFYDETFRIPALKGREYVKPASESLPQGFCPSGLTDHDPAAAEPSPVMGERLDPSFSGGSFLLI